MSNPNPEFADKWGDKDSNGLQWIIGVKRGQPRTDVYLAYTNQPYGYKHPKFAKGVNIGTVVGPFSTKEKALAYIKSHYPEAKIHASGRI